MLIVNDTIAMPTASLSTSDILYTCWNDGGGILTKNSNTTAELQCYDFISAIKCTANRFTMLCLYSFFVPYYKMQRYRQIHSCCSNMWSKLVNCLSPFERLIDKNLKNLLTISEFTLLVFFQLLAFQRLYRSEQSEKSSSRWWSTYNIPQNNIVHGG